MGVNDDPTFFVRFVVHVGDLPPRVSVFVRHVDEALNSSLDGPKAEKVGPELKLMPPQIIDSSKY